MRVLAPMKQLLVLAVAAVVLASCNAVAMPSRPQMSGPPQAGDPTPIASAAASPGGVHGEIAYVAGDDPQIFLLDLATGDSRQLTELGPQDAELSLAAPMRPVLSCGFGPSSLAWSPDGSMLAFAYGSCDSVVYIVDLGGELRRIADGTAPAWSPDGAQLVFAPNIPYSPCGAACQPPPVEGAWDLWVVDVTGDVEPERLTTNGGSFAARTPRYSPDGSLIAFAGPHPDPDSGEFTATYVAKSDGTAQQLVARGAWPSGWLPDGRLVVVEEASGSSHAVDVASAEAELLLGGALVDQVSPDGSLFLVTTFDPGTGANRVHLVDADGAELTQLPGYGPTWAPDASAFVVSDMDELALVVVGRDGTRFGTYPAGVIGGDYRSAWRPGS